MVPCVSKTHLRQTTRFKDNESMTKYKSNHKRSGSIRRYLIDNRESIRRKTLRASMVKDFTLSAGKIVLGFYTLSVFLCISALSSFLNGFARHTYLEGGKIAQGDSEKEYTYYLRIALLILGGSAAFTLYMARLFFYPTRVVYGLIPSLAIATIAFADLGFAIVGVARTKGLLESAMKMLNLASSFGAILLTQVAIMSFATTDDMSIYNATGGVVFGGLGMLVALYMIAKYMLRRRTRSHQH